MSPVFQALRGTGLVLICLLMISQLGLPNDCQLEFVNGGHGIKNPLAVEGQRQPGTNRDEERTNRTPPSKVTRVFYELYFACMRLPLLKTWLCCNEI